MTICHVGFSQYDSSSKENRQLRVLNRNNEPREIFNVKDYIVIRSSEKKTVRGQIISIDSGSLQVNNQVIHYDEIKKLRKIKNRTSNVVVGGILIAGGITTFAVMSGGDIKLEHLPRLFALGMGLSVAGVAVIIPSGIRIGKSKKFMVVSP